MLHTTSKHVVCFLAALLITAAARASEPRIFPEEPTSRVMSSGTPQQLPALEAPEEINRGPLRVVIPNIKKIKPKTVEEQVAPTPRRAAAPKIVPIVPAPTTIATPVQAPATTATHHGVTFSSLPESFLASARNVWDNGVTMPNWEDIPIVRNLPKPSIEFAGLPAGWLIAQAPSKPTIVAANATVSLDALTPAAGEPAAPLLQTISPTDISEPAPTLSEQSKNIADKIPPVADKKPKKEIARKVDITHDTSNPDGLGTGEISVSKHEAMGLKMIAKRPKLDPAYELERAYNALLAGKSDDAIQIYEDILTGDPKNKEALFGLASTYHRAGQIDMARALYGKLLEIDPKNRDGLNNFLVLLADEAPQEALSQMEALEQQNPAFSPIPAQMAIIYQKLGDKEKAVDKMYRALAIAPENVTYRYNLAIMLDKNHNYEEAGKLYAQILDSHAKGEQIPGDATKIQQRLTFIRSNGSTR